VDVESLKSSLLEGEGVCQEPPTPPPAAVGPLSVGESSLLHALRKLNIEDRTKTVDKLVNDDPDTAHRLRDTGNP
jgi:hypothetical protein